MIASAASPDEFDRLAFLEAKRAELEALEAKAVYLENHALECYKPHPKQDAFHRSVARFRAFFSGNRGGKSTGGVAEDCGWALGERIWYPKSDPARYSLIPKRPVKILVLTTDWEKVREVFTEDQGDNIGKVFKFLPPDAISGRPRRNHTGVIDFITLTNGSTIYFDTVRSFLSNKQSVESSDHDFIHVDEPIPEPMWKGASRGLVDRAGAAIFTLTPLEEVWINDKFVEGGKDYWYIRGSMEDNPSLSAEAIEAFRKDLTPEEQECRINGVPLENAGRIYKEYDPAVHTLRAVPRGWADFDAPSADCTLFVYIDPHPSTPTAISFFAIPRSDDCIIQFNEIFAKGTVPEWSQLIHEKLTFTYPDKDGVPKIVKRKPSWVRIDPSAYIENPVSGFSMALEFQNYGIPVEPATKALMQGILAVKQRLKNRSPEQMLYFSPNLVETAREFGRYRWGMENGVPTNKPHDKDDHMMENLYRCVLDEPAWMRPEREDEGQIILRPLDTRLDTKVFAY